ncbi:uncharacterized protein EV422DRAFT_209359 [Fimicolochytrium jonesii]|uniref:uncharacterized protein n=1 Tax=Fimicolochytrium jonesii TaxID=1396493 RepID=UPI0022FDBA78|nr:uncharacterized protein EV422DRAFT_209359 [Fimicolochytrium jonesii]KAI8817878.1 hypothetical protein EV422DRAFT_209359 [Fimicolochytrium jonesii]
MSGLRFSKFDNFAVPGSLLIEFISLFSVYSLQMNSPVFKPRTEGVVKFSFTMQNSKENELFWDVQWRQFDGTFKLYFVRATHGVIIGTEDVSEDGFQISYSGDRRIVSLEFPEAELLPHLFPYEGDIDDKPPLCLSSKPMGNSLHVRLVGDSIHWGQSAENVEEVLTEDPRVSILRKGGKVCGAIITDPSKTVLREGTFDRKKLREDANKYAEAVDAAVDALC